jgi:uncharacterized membrane protein
MLKVNKITLSLILISILGIVFDLVRVFFWGKTTLLYLVLNLFLAWIPYVISLYFIREDLPVNKFIPLFIIWLLFFPNAPYLVTDILHVASSLPSLLWYDSILFFLFGWIGLLLGILSLLHIHQFLKTHYNYLISELIVFGICFLSSFGIYLGRFERWNSWDLFINPLELIRHSFNVSAGLFHAGTPSIFVIVFTIFMYAVYKTVYILIFHIDEVKR